MKPVTNNLFLVDAAGIGGRNMSLPGEISTATVSGGEVSRPRVAFSFSGGAAIVATGFEPINIGGLTR